jgi:hypothetical protein
MKADGVTSVASSLAANMPSLAPRPSSGDTLHELDSLHRHCVTALAAQTLCDSTNSTQYTSITATCITDTLEQLEWV